MTVDKDFCELVFRQHQIAEGVILIRLSGLTSVKKADIVLQAVTEHADALHDCSVVIEPGRIRIRRRIS
jgi:predicted nuclease of predicted toxin-antitoxin system